MKSEVKSNHEILKLIEISKLYYEKNYTQARIADVMEISRPLVSKLLAEAKALGIVKIEIKSPIQSNALLMKQLSRKYNLEGGMIVPTGTGDKNISQHVLISQGAQYIKQQISSLNYIGLGWGYTMGGLVDELEPLTNEYRKKGHVCPIVGSAPNDIKWYQSNELTRIFARKTGFLPHYIHAPAFPMTLESKKLFEDTQEYQEMLSLWHKMDAVIVGAGIYPSVPDQATAARFGTILKERGGVGMIATYYYDEQGHFIESPDDIVIRIPLETLERTKVILVVGSGERKISSVRGALMTGIVSQIVIDDQTANELI